MFEKSQHVALPNFLLQVLRAHKAADTVASNLGGPIKITHTILDYYIQCKLQVDTNQQLDTVSAVI